MSIPAHKTWILDVRAVLWRLQLCLKRSFWLDWRLQPSICFVTMNINRVILSSHNKTWCKLLTWAATACSLCSLMTIFQLCIYTSATTCELTQVNLKIVSRLLGRTEFERMLSIKWNISIRSLLMRRRCCRTAFLSKDGGYSGSTADWSGSRYSVMIVMVYTPAVTSIKKMHRWHQVPLDTNQSSAVLSCPDRLLLLNQCQPDGFNGPTCVIVDDLIAFQ